MNTYTISLLVALAIGSYASNHLTIQVASLGLSSFITLFFILVSIAVGLDTRIFKDLATLKIYSWPIIGALIGVSFGIFYSSYVGVEQVVPVAYMATYIGGSVNFAHIINTYASGNASELISTGIVIDALLTGIYMGFVVLVSFFFGFSKSNKVDESTKKVETTFRELIELSAIVFGLWSMYLGLKFLYSLEYLAAMAAIFTGFLIAYLRLLPYRFIDAVGAMTKPSLVMVFFWIGSNITFDRLTDEWHSYLITASIIVITQTVFICLVLWFKRNFYSVNERILMIVFLSTCIGGVGSGIMTAYLFGRPNFVATGIVYAALSYLLSFFLSFSLSQIIL